ncbi:hypothetical protein ACFSF0_11575 [Ottowia flava]|uniref:Uncharacterized protein n=1 Tax=Ottowia flava TaxID=2675430 RepID=A0ABW4KY48_9BURK|nr:hypothetical protein [Ottowia sp. GY511]
MAAPSAITVGRAVARRQPGQDQHGFAFQQAAQGHGPVAVLGD